MSSSIALVSWHDTTLRVMTSETLRLSAAVPLLGDGADDVALRDDAGDLTVVADDDDRADLLGAELLDDVEKRGVGPRGRDGPSLEFQYGSDVHERILQRPLAARAASTRLDERVAGSLPSTSAFQLAVGRTLTGHDASIVMQSLSPRKSSVFFWLRPRHGSVEETE